jgi:hypothetical protein
MRIAIFSDIHGNLPALQAVLADIAKQKLEIVNCLGNLVGYGASPDAVTERIRAEGVPTIMGNYDDGVGYDRDECGCAYQEPRDRELGGTVVRLDESTGHTGQQGIPPNTAARAAIQRERQGRAPRPRQSAQDQ